MRYIRSAVEAFRSLITNLESRGRRFYVRLKSLIIRFLFLIILGCFFAYVMVAFTGLILFILGYSLGKLILYTCGLITLIIALVFLCYAVYEVDWYEKNKSSNRRNDKDEKKFREIYRKYTNGHQQNCLLHKLEKRQN